jgi:hypothetical protein
MMWLADGFLQWRLGFSPSVVHEGFVMNKFTLGWIFSKEFGFPLPIINAPVFHPLIYGSRLIK